MAATAAGPPPGGHPRPACRRRTCRSGTTRTTPTPASPASGSATRCCRCSRRSSRAASPRRSARTAAQLRDDGEALDAAAHDLLTRAAGTQRHRAGTRNSRARRAALDPTSSAPRPPPSAGGPCAPGCSPTASPGSPIPTCAPPTISSAAGAVGRRVALPQRVGAGSRAWEAACARRRGRAPDEAPGPWSHAAPFPTPGGPSVYDGDIASVLITADAIREDRGARRGGRHGLRGTLLGTDRPAARRRPQGRGDVHDRPRPRPAGPGPARVHGRELLRLGDVVVGGGADPQGPRPRHRRAATS